MVTPVEKVGITVEDVPFIATDIDIIKKGKIVLLKFTTNIGDFTYLEENNQFKILFKEGHMCSKLYPWEQKLALEVVYIYMH